MFYPTIGGEKLAIERQRIGTATAYNNYISTDILGSSNIITWSNPAYLAELTVYTSYDGPHADYNTNYNTPRKCIGEMYDSGSGLSYLNARYYFAAIGKFYG